MLYEVKKKKTFAFYIEHIAYISQVETVTVIHS